LTDSYDFEKGEYTIVSNMRNGEPIDRIYGGGHLRLRLIQKDGTEYKGSITQKSIMAEGINGKIKSHIYVTDDKRTFDRSGFPVYNIDIIEEDVTEEVTDATQDQSTV
jgi:hypothetical protein|tara:strand:+ start:1905 stop:2228 length:324 start_codon:yes stop_codon:yes gene_type:complete